jgi:aspartyl-tRNA synthetase
MMLKRTHTCGELRPDHEGMTVRLNGWIASFRDHGGVTFIDLYDRWGITQIVFDPICSPEAHAEARHLRSQYVIAVEGTVRMRPEGMENEQLASGAVDVYVTRLQLLNRSKTPPFDVLHSFGVHPETRLAYRYLDLRNPEQQKRLLLRSRVSGLIRSWFLGREFAEIETPILGRATPEGARDYLVPSRVRQGSFYALPQSPQLYKQALMVSGFDRYFQIARCFRDEDLRAERQPEFTQVDLEMSFVGEDDVMAVAEGLVAAVFKEVLGADIKTPFERMAYADAVGRYGLDKPDLRFGLPLADISDIAGACGFKVFADVVKNGGIVKALNAKGCESFTRKEIDDLAPFVAVYKAKGLAWIKVRENEWQSPIAKFFSSEEKQRLAEQIDMAPGDLIFFVADQPNIVNDALGNLRNHLGKKLGLIDEKQFRFLWVTHFPLLEYDETEKRYQSMHHPFTSPVESDYGKLETDPLAVSSRAYDLVLNGSEIGGGSIRIHQKDLQVRVLRTLGMKPEEYEEKFGFLLNALDSGAPPHGGLAFGFDRLMTILCGGTSIRDVIPFPKTQKGTCPLTGAPSPAGRAQLKELSLKTDLE